MRSLMAEALDLPADYDPDSRADALMTLVQHEMRRLPALPLSLPFPAHTKLSDRCRAFLLAPTAHATIESWCARAWHEPARIYAAVPARRPA